MVDQPIAPSDQPPAPTRPPSPAPVTWPPMSLLGIGLTTFFFAAAVFVFFATGDPRSSFSWLRLTSSIWLVELSRRASRVPRVEGPPPRNPNPIVTTLVILSAVFAIFVLFDGVNAPQQRILPRGFYDALFAAFTFIGGVLEPFDMSLTPAVCFALSAAGYGVMLFGEWRYWARHALDPRRSSSP